MKISIQQPENFPWIGYFDKLRQVDKVVFLDNVQFKKRYFENRNKIRTAQGWTWLNVPVKTKGRFTQKINEVEIDNEQLWQQKMISTVSLNYKKAPYWKDFGEELCALIENPYERLVDFNLSVIRALMEKMDIRPEWRLASELKTQSAGSGLILEICQKMNAKVYLSGRDGKNYLKGDEFARQGIEVEYQDFQHPVYSQFHGDFIAGMSSIDLYFNHGPQSREIIEEAQKGHKK